MTLAPDGAGSSPVQRIRKIRNPQSATAVQEPISPVPVTETSQPQPQPEKPAQPENPTQSDWKSLPIRSVWQYFAKVKQLLTLHPDGENVKRRYKEVKDYLFNYYRKDVERVVNGYCRRKMPHYSLADSTDLMQAALIKHYRLIDEYDLSVGTEYMQFTNAKNASAIRGAVIDYLRSLQEYPRDIAIERREVKPMMEALQNKLRRKPSREEFCDEYGWNNVCEKTGRTWGTIIFDHLFWSGVYNQRPNLRYSDNEGEIDHDSSFGEWQALSGKEESRDQKMQSVDSETIILSAITDEDIKYVIWAYYFMRDTTERISQTLKRSGRKTCSLSWVAGKREQGEAILRQKFGLEGMKHLAELSRNK